MTEQEWLVCEDPRAMYAGVPDPKVASVNDRRWRLLACAIQEAWLPFMGPVCDIEQIKQSIESAIEWAETGERSPRYVSSSYFVLNLSACNGTYWLINNPHGIPPGTIPRNKEMDRIACDLFREVIGNPFRTADLPKQKVICDWCNGSKKLNLTRRKKTANIHMACMPCDGRGWHNTQKNDVSIHAKEIAQHIYTTQDYAGMPILADAMEEAGCEPTTECPECEGTGSINLGLADGICNCTPRIWQKNYWRGSGYIPNPILEHLRGSNTHVRGCWALDLILGKE